jgi:signal recognition particle receptor subunit beta
VVSKKLRVVDLPGHPRVANKLDVHVANARSAVFVLDAVDFASRRREVAERLRDALVTIARAKRRGTPFPVLVACNKSEKIAAHPIAFIKKMLEKEIDALERTAAGQLQDTDEGKDGFSKTRDDTRSVSVARRGVDPKKPFECENAVADVSFSAVSVAENDLDELKSFAVVR